MIYNNHYNLAGKHSFLSASGYHWTNYDAEKLKQSYLNHKAKERGTMLHDFASVAINERVKLANHKKTLNMFVNDAIGYRMESEQVLYYSDNAFGTVDAISFEELEDGVKLLRIHDLKTGFSKASVRQLEVYAAYFCLEYNVNPYDIQYDLRIYQSNQIYKFDTSPDDIMDIMQKIKEFDVIIESLKV